MRILKNEDTSIDAVIVMFSGAHIRRETDLYCNDVKAVLSDPKARVLLVHTGANHACYGPNAFSRRALHSLMKDEG